MPTTADMRQFLISAFSDEEITTLCFDRFRPVYENFSGGMSKGQKIQQLLEHCERHDEWPRLLSVLQRERPQQFARFLEACAALDHLNHELFDEHKEREVKITLADVDAVLGDDLFRRGTGYFDGVWTQVSESAQRDLLRCLARRDAPWTFAELEEVTHNTPEVLRQHLQLAERRDILRQRDGAWEFCVPLMRRWIN